MIGKLSVKSKVLVMVFMLFFSVLAGSVTASMESPVCGDEYLDEGESCDDGLNNGQPNYCNTECTDTTAPMCGNQVIEEGESCDDGDLNGQPTYCDTSCMGITPAICGNQAIEEGESCDDGANNGQPTYCDTSCMGITPAMCGNQAIEEGESCDDGELNGQEGYCNTECSDQTFLPDNEPATINSVGITPDNYACNLESQEENPNSEITISADV